MNGVTSRFSRAVIGMLGLLVAVGCAHRPPIPSKLELGPRTEFGTVAVAAHATKDPRRLSGPMTRGEGAAWRAFEYSATAIYVGAGAGAGGGLFLALFTLPVTVTVGGVVGAIQGTSASAVQTARAPVERALLEADVPRKLRDRVVALGAERTSETLVAVAAEDRGVDSMPLSGAARTLLELRLVEVRLVRPQPGDMQKDPPLTFGVKVRLRLIGLADGRELFARDVDSAETTRVFSSWIEDDAREFRAALAEAIEAIAVRIVEEVLG
jgi:hypothetical protein